MRIEDSEMSSKSHGCAIRKNRFGRNDVLIASLSLEVTKRLIPRLVFYLNHFRAFGLWCGHPGQQQGRFLPASISSCSRMRCSFLVFSCLTIVVQQIHSLRASGVSLFHLSNNAVCESNTSFRSSGTLCITPSSIIVVVIFQRVFN